MWNRHVVQHPLSVERAREVTQQAFEHYRERFARYRPELRWLAPYEAEVSFAVGGYALHASLELVPGAIALELDAPSVLRVFRSRAIAVVEREVQHWIEQAAGQSSP